jgi:uncharacterized membrane protein
MEKCELQRMCVKLFNQFEDFKNSSIDHLQRLKNFEIEKDALIGKIKSLEDGLMKSKLPLEKPSDSSVGIDSIASIHMLCLLIELCLLNLACLNIIPILLVGIKGKVLKGLGIKKSLLSLLVITVALVVISALIAFRYVLRNLKINCMCLGKMNQVLRTKLRI